jgi:hypothetical protein
LSIGEEGQLVACEWDVDVAEVVLAGAPDRDRTSHRGAGTPVAGAIERMFAGLGARTRTNAHPRSRSALSA